jgi:hypothetical protein
MAYVECPRCGAELDFRLFRDGDGDPSVPGGTRSWLDAECVEQPCACELTPEEWGTLADRAIEAGIGAEPSYDF